MSNVMRLNFYKVEIDGILSEARYLFQQLTKIPEAERFASLNAGVAQRLKA